MIKNGGIPVLVSDAESKAPEKHGIDVCEAAF